jgi:L-ascorbate metabolism protein UlaG (beta-lactamase superfamily)
VKLTLNGHACVTIEAADGRILVTDPYLHGAFGGKITHAPVRVAADVVWVSHGHIDHSHVTPELGPGDGALPIIVDRSGTAGGIEFRVRSTYHDREGGTRMGMTGMVAFEIDGVAIAHLGDIGCDLTPEDVAALGPVDLLLWPVGGTYTLGPKDASAVLDALQPRLAIPIHFEHERCQLGMEPVEALTPHLQVPWSRPGTSTWQSDAGLPESTEVLILEPAL